MGPTFGGSNTRLARKGPEPNIHAAGSIVPARLNVPMVFDVETVTNSHRRPHVVIRAIEIVYPNFSPALP